MSAKCQKRTLSLPHMDRFRRPATPRLWTLHHSVLPCRLAKPIRAELGRTLLRLEVHVHQAEPIAVAVDPLEIVHRAPLKVALHGHAVSRRTLELRHVTA